MTVTPPAALIVDRDPERLGRLSEELRACGFEAQEAPTLDAAFASLAERRFDLVVCDAQDCGPARRPIWQALFAATGDRATLVALVGAVNSHQAMLASCDGSRLLIGAPTLESDPPRQAGELIRRRFGSLLAVRHDAQPLDAPHLADSRRHASEFEATS